MLTTSLVLITLGFIMLIGWLNFVIIRYEAFHRFIRKKEFRVEKERLKIFYSIIFFVTGVPLFIGAIIGLAIQHLFDVYSLWLYIAVAAIGLIGILYSNISNQFIKQPLENDQ